MLRLAFIAITTLATCGSILMGCGIESRELPNHPDMGVFMDVLAHLVSYAISFAPAAYFILSFFTYEFWLRFKVLRVIGVLAHAVVFFGIIWLFFTPVADIASFILFLHVLFLASFWAAVWQRHYQRPHTVLEPPPLSQRD